MRINIQYQTNGSAVIPLLNLPAITIAECQSGHNLELPLLRHRVLPYYQFVPPQCLFSFARSCYFYTGFLWNGFPFGGARSKEKRRRQAIRNGGGEGNDKTSLPIGGWIGLINWRVTKLVDEWRQLNFLLKGIFINKKTPEIGFYGWSLHRSQHATTHNNSRN